VRPFSRGRDHRELFRRLAGATDFLGDQTGEHCARVAQNASAVWRALGLAADGADRLGIAATLHDIGKVSIPRSILLKPGRLTDSEFLIVQGHSRTGAILLGGSDIPELHLAAKIARSHHERWDGSGYPDRVSRNDIPLEARIVGVCDTFDALSHERPYKAAWSTVESAQYLQEEAGSKFDPLIVEVFTSLLATGHIVTEPTVANQPEKSNRYLN